MSVFPRVRGSGGGVGDSGMRAARRCFLLVGGAWEDEVIVVDVGEFYAVGGCARRVVHRG